MAFRAIPANGLSLSSRLLFPFASSQTSNVWCDPQGHLETPTASASSTMFSVGTLVGIDCVGYGIAVAVGCSVQAMISVPSSITRERT